MILLFKGVIGNLQLDYFTSDTRVERACASCMLTCGQMPCVFTYTTKKIFLALECEAISAAVQCSVPVQCCTLCSGRVCFFVPIQRGLFIRTATCACVHVGA